MKKLIDKIRSMLAGCQHEKYQENMACHGICLSCGKDLGFIQDLRDANPRGETGMQSWQPGVEGQEVE